MSQNRPTPGWGKAIGILMIIFGSLGVFFQFYKMMIPTIMGVGNKMMEFSSQTAPVEHQRNIEMSQAFMGEFWSISPLQSKVLLWGGIFGIMVCTVYIIAGAKLLKAVPANYFMARNILLASLCINLITIILLFIDPFSLVLFGMLIYIILGAVIDLVLVLILVNSDKTKYGIGVDPSKQVYTTDAANEEIL